MRAVLLGIMAGGALVVLAGCGVLGREEPPGYEICAALDANLVSAVTGSKPPAVGDAGPMRPGSCSTKATRRLRLPATGDDRPREVTFAGRVLVETAGRWNARTARRSFIAAGVPVRPVPELGASAFVVTEVRAKPEAAPGQGGGVEGPAAELALPATVYWQRGRVVLTVSATRDGADPAEARRISVRLAKLVARYPVEPGGTAGN